MRHTISTEIIQSARITVREIGYLAQKIEGTGVYGEVYSCAMHAYDMACSHLVKLDPQGAAEFIKSTYGPAFRQTT